jgi:SepF-like predicted cell division protein (DUF552 family)
MLYLSKQFHLQHKSINRCLNGIIVSLSFVVMSGCEHIRLNDLSSNGSNTLFYIAEDIDQDQNQFSDLEGMTVSTPQSEELHLDINYNIDQQVETQSMRLNIDQEFSLSEEAIPAVEATETSFFESLFSYSQTTNNLSDSIASEELIEVSDNDKRIEENEVTVDIAAQELLEVKATVNEAVSDDLLMAQVNNLNTLDPSSAGQKIQLHRQDSLLIAPTQVKEKTSIKSKASFPPISKDLKKALASTSLEILQWQLEMQKAKNDRIDCRLSSPTLQIDSHQYTTQLWLNIENNRLFVNATTDIDPTLPFVGIHFDDGRFEPFSLSSHPQYAIWEGDLGDLIKSNKQMKLVLSGNDLKSQIQLASIDLTALRHIYPKYLACTQRLIGQ